jgi:xanthine dehydrogenase accessory factor
MSALDYYRQLASLLAQGPVVLCTVTNIQGSVPREVGAKMMVYAGGSLGTIGGGAGEAKVIQQAKIVLKTGAKQGVEIDLSGAPHRATQGICGGKMQVWLERWSGESAIAVVQQMLSRLQSGQSVTLITPFDGEQFPYLSDRPEALAHAFIEVLQPPPILLIVGAGHVGKQLAKVADLIGFEIVVQDDRPEWANIAHYPQAKMICTGTIADVIQPFSTHPGLYVALVTRGFQQDLEALNLLLRYECQYIGMIGSEKRVRQVYQTLEKNGIEKTKLRTIYAPIGLDIGALTPEEIAVSIGAELIMVRRGGTGRSLCDRLKALF